VYDGTTLNIANEIPLPGRLLVADRIYTLSLGADGKYAFVYNMDPASSFAVVDLVHHKVARVVELPGCGLIFPAPDGRTASLCGDGSLATVTFDRSLHPSIKRSPAFFSAENDPIFDNSVSDRSTGRTLFLTYSGLIYDAQLGETAKIGEPWSIQAAAGLTRVTGEPLTVSWLPGGGQPIAFHRASGKAYILMHIGEFWTPKVAAVELWEVDVNAHRVLRRQKIDDPAARIAVSQDPAPLIYLNTVAGKLTILDAATFDVKQVVDRIGSGNLSVPGF
jgi:methylamine dehydrogenase heavy chain